jgi:predicted phage-related endonuclease
LAIEEAMKTGVWTKHGHRRLFIGGSDARIIMGNDEDALLHLWRETEEAAAEKHMAQIQHNMWVTNSTAAVPLPPACRDVAAARPRARRLH